MWHRRALLVCVLAVAVGPAQVRADDPPPGFRSLFNGKDLTGWTPYKCERDAWEVRGGVLQTSGNDAKSGWLVTDDEYTDFELRLEYRLSRRANSGVALRAPRDGDLAFSGTEVQLLDDDGYPNLQPNQYTGSIYRVAARTETAAKPVGEWNQLAVTARGGRVTVTLNGTKIVDTDLADHRGKADQVPGVLRRKGRLALQTHTGGAEFRNLFVRPLTAAAAARPTLVLNAPGHTATVHKVLFTPDGKTLISVSEDKTVRFWDVATGEQLHILRPPAGAGDHGKLQAAALSPDGELLAVGGYDNPIYLISTATRQIVRVLTDHEGGVLGLNFTAKGRGLVAACSSGRAWVYWTATGKTAGYSGRHKGAVTEAAISPDATKLVTASTDRTVRVWGLKDMALVAEINDHEKPVSGAAWRPDGEEFVTISGGKIRSWGADGAAKKLLLDRDEVRGTSVTYTPDGKGVVYTGTGAAGNGPFVAALIDAATGKELGASPHCPNSQSTAAVSPDGRLIASAGFYATIVVWRPDGSMVHELRSRGSFRWSTGWNRTGTALAWGDRNNYMVNQTANYLHDFGPVGESLDLASLERVPPGDGYTHGGTLELDGLTAKRLNRDQLVVQQGGETVATITAAGFRSATLLEGGRAILGKDSGEIGLYDTKTGKLIHSYHEHISTVWNISVSPDGRHFSSASADQTVRVWALDAPGPSLLAVFAAGREWIAWTPEGYYACSPGGEKLIGWRVDNGPDKLSTTLPAGQFRATLYRPDVIKRLLGAGSVEKALAAADRATGGRPTQKTEVSEVLPPKVGITSPAKSGTKLTSGRFEVSATATPVGQPVTALKLLIDGRPHGEAQAVRGAGEARETWAVELPPGTHRLAVVATTAASQATSDEVEVTIAPAGGDAKPPSSNLHVLAIGINAYPGRMALDCAVPDAKAITDAFRTHGKGLYTVRDTVLLDKQATRAAILKELDALAARAKPGDVAVFYYAGHGDAKAAGSFHILPVDTDVKRLADTGISGEELRARLGKLPCTALLIMDCCFAGSFDAKKVKKRALPTAAGDLVRELVSDDQGLVVMCGASKEQESGEESKLGHGYFTLALTEGLSGKAASKRDGLVYLSGLQVYVEERVRELSNDDQYPTMGRPTLIRSFPLSKP